MASLELIHQQCLQTRQIGGWFDHPSRGIIEVAGVDRIRFLHNVLTNDIKKLVPSTGVPACLLNAQAKIIAVMNVLCLEHVIWLACDYALKNQLMKALEKLIIMEQVSLKDRSEEIKLISVHGPKSKVLIANLFKQVPAPGLLNGLATQGIYFARVNFISEDGYGLLIPKQEAAKWKALISKEASALDITAMEPETLEILRIGAAKPKYQIDYDETNIPLECWLDHTISFTKGCFPGQEIIARLDSRGGVSKKLCGLALKGETPMKKNDPILFEGVQVGHVTSSAFIPILKRTVALAYIQKEHWEIGCEVVIRSGKNQMPARVEELPFY